MTAVAAPVGRTRAGATARGSSRAAPPRATTRTKRTAPAARATRVVAPARARTRAGAGVVVVVASVFVLVSAVLFHVVLAQGQLQLDRLDDRIATERLEYEKLRLQVSTLSSPQRIIEQAQALGFVIPDTPRTYIEVAGAKVPAGQAVNPPTTLGDWEDVKPHLGDTQP